MKLSVLMLMFMLLILLLLIDAVDYAAADADDAGNDAAVDYADGVVDSSSIASAAVFLTFADACRCAKEFSKRI